MTLPNYGYVHDDAKVILTIGNAEIINTTVAAMKIQSKYGEPMGIILDPHLEIIIGDPEKIRDQFG